MDSIASFGVVHGAIGTGAAGGRRSRPDVAAFGIPDDTQSILAALTLGTLAQGAFVMGADCRLSYANRAARSMLAAATALRLRGDRVQAAGPDADGSFARMVAATATFGNTNAMCIGTSHGSRLMLTTKPLRGSAVSAGLGGGVGGGVGGGGSVLMLAADMDRGERQCASQLKSAFGLTAAEADIARALGTGASPAETAVARGALLSTVQSQIKSVASKLGCRRQSEIAAIVQTMPKFLED